MTLAERKHAAELCRAHWPGKVVVGVSSTAVPDCIDLLKHAAQQVETTSQVTQLPASSCLFPLALPPCLASCQATQPNHSFCKAAAAL